MGRVPSRPIAIITRDELANTTLAIPNPPAMNPMPMSTVMMSLWDSIDRKTLKFGE